MSALYAWGANSHGQLGLGFVSEQVVHPTRVCELPDTVQEGSIKNVVGGGGHTFILTHQGRIFGAGWNSSGQVGDGTQVRSVPCFQQIRGLEGHQMTNVACGWHHSIGLSNKGRIWVWGSNSHGQLGLPKDEVPYSSLPICLELHDVVSVAAGLRHTAVATKEGTVYTWGSGNHGQLGHIDSQGKVIKLQPTPKLVELIEGKVLSVVCGQNTTFGLTTEGQLLAWGDNKWGQLAHDPKSVAYFTCPLPIPQNYFGSERINWIEAGWTHVAVGVTSGKVYIWGRSDYGQLGPLEDSIQPNQIYRYRYVPSVLNLPNKRILDLVCGSEHNLALIDTENEESASGSCLYTWGWNEHGNCGDGSVNNILTPVQVILPGNIKVVGVGSGHSFSLVQLL